MKAPSDASWIVAALGVATALGPTLAMSGCASDEPSSAETSGSGGAGGGDASSSTSSSSASGGAPPVDVLEAAPRAETPAQHATLAAPANVRVASLVHGGAAFGTEEGLVVADLGTGELMTLDLFEDDGRVVSPGAVTAVGRRPGGGVFVAAEVGLLHDFETVLLRSPLEQTLDVGALGWIDARPASDGGEELWVVGDGGAAWIGESIVEFSIDGLAVERALGVGDGVAVVVAGGDLVRVDLPAETASIELQGLGAVHDGARAEDGTLWLATDLGLVKRAPDGAYTRFTLAAPGEEAVPVRRVASAYGAVAALGDAGLVGVDAEGPFLIADEVPEDGPLTIDGAGDVWVATGTELWRFATGEPVTFAGSVAPFLADHCASCHEGDDEAAPRLDLGDYDEVRELAPDLLDRVTRSSNPMPPTGLLDASEVAPLLRWIATGYAP